MAHLLLVGPWERAMEELAALLDAGYAVTLIRRDEEVPATADDRFALILAAVTEADSLRLWAETARRLAVPWLACCVAADAGIAAAAYRAGALVVVPREGGADLVQRTVARLLDTFGLGTDRSREAVGHRSHRHHRAGERIELEPQSALEVLEGIVSLTAVQDDGGEALLGLYGPGQVVVGHPMASCHVRLVSQTDVKVWVEPWGAAVQRPGFADKLCERLVYMETWASVQARPQVEQRLLGLLALLAEQFGRPTPRGTLIDVRITHAQLASAVGATRATVTRRLGLLRRAGQVISLRSRRGECFCLPQPVDRSLPAARAYR